MHGLTNANRVKVCVRAYVLPRGGGGAEASGASRNAAVWRPEGPLEELGVRQHGGPGQAHVLLVRQTLATGEPFHEHISEVNDKLAELPDFAILGVN